MRHWTYDLSSVAVNWGLGKRFLILSFPGWGTTVSSTELCCSCLALPRQVAQCLLGHFFGLSLGVTVHLCLSVWVSVCWLCGRHFLELLGQADHAAGSCLVIKPTSAHPSPPVFLFHSEWHLPLLLWFLVSAFSSGSFWYSLDIGMILLAFYLEEVCQNLWLTGISPSHALMNWFYFCDSWLLCWWISWRIWTGMLISLSSAVDFLFKSTFHPQFRKLSFWVWRRFLLLLIVFKDFSSITPILAVLGSLFTSEFW